MKTRHFCVWSVAKISKGIKRKGPFMMLFLAIIVFLFKWSLLCVNMQPKIHISRVCRNYENGLSIGNLCQYLCQSKRPTFVSCNSFNLEKESVFSGLWMNNSAIFKSIKPTDNQELSSLLLSSDKDVAISIESDFVIMIKKLIKTKFNLSINDIDAKRMSYIQFSQPGGNRYTEMLNAWSLLQDNEYLALSLYEKFDLFPKLLGTCGGLYAVEKMDSINGYWHLMTVYDSQNEWVKRVKISLMILDFLIYLEEKLPEPLVICDVTLSHFGVTGDFKKIKFLDLDAVHPISVANKIIASGSNCNKHSDCDLNNCRSFCNFITYKCQHGIVNNNLQIVCERIFLGWMMSPRILVPGLLFGPKAPPVLIEVLEKCANPSNEDDTPRSPATREVRTRLYNLLTHLAM